MGNNNLINHITENKFGNKNNSNNNSHNNFNNDFNNESTHSTDSAKHSLPESSALHGHIVLIAGVGAKQVSV